MNEALQQDLSIEAERLVARQFMGRVQWEMIAIGLGQLALWLGCWWAVLAGMMPLWLGFVVTSISTCFAYLTSHEGQHGNLSGRKRGRKWLDFWVGQLSLIPLAMSHEVLRVTHMKHHAYTNDPELDVDIFSRGDHWWQPALAVHSQLYAKGPVAIHAERDPAFLAGLQRGIPVERSLKGIRLGLAVFFPLETLLLWWLPSKLALSYLAVFFSWQPHRPMTATGRYRDTRFWRIPAPRFLCQSMQTHVIHHLYPGIPHWDEPAAMEALKPFMVERGVPGAEEIPERVRWNPLLAGRRPVA